jgi:transcriptional regulator with XRE-family HTH domain
MTAVQRAPHSAGVLLRQWREHRRLSQLELSNRAEISSRHLSFVETGRSTPSRQMLLHLAEQLEIPLRERNSLLLAAGYAPMYAASPWGSPQLAALRAAVGLVLTGLEPYPALAVDRCWNLVEGNRTVGLLIGDAAAELLVPPVNVLRVAMHPAGLAPQIANFGEWRAHVLARVRRQVDETADPDLAALYRELQDYPCDDLVPDVETSRSGDLVIPLRIRFGDRQLALLSTTTVFGTPVDVTVAELAIESFLPADRATAEILAAAQAAAPEVREDVARA